MSRYAECKLMHLDIPNIHAMRESYDNLRSLALSSTNSKWLASLESTQWLNYISLILKVCSVFSLSLSFSLPPSLSFSHTHGPASDFVPVLECIGDKSLHEAAERQRPSSLQ